MSRLPTYSYNPHALAASYKRLKGTEVELMERTPMTDAPMQQALADNDNSGNSAYPPQRPPLVVAATQITGAGLPDSDVAGYCFRAEQAIEKASTLGANLILLPELWSGPYICQTIENVLIDLADPVDQHVLIKRMQLLAKLYGVVLPVSIFERQNNAYYNSVVMIDSDGTNLGTYRKSHIPDAVGYQEKFYFTPGDTGFKVFDTKVGKVGVAICWDQWFPEAARAMALAGAEVILYPTAIGSEPLDPSYDSADHWQRVMQGHAAANMVPVVASNRFGTEVLLNPDGSERQRMHFYGRSLITDHTGAKIAECADNTDDEPVVVVAATLDPERYHRERAAWGLFRDRRPDLYPILLTKDGRGT